MLFEHIIELIDKLAWPIVALIGIILFRGSIAKLEKRFDNSQFGDKEAKFSRDCDETFRLAEQVNLPELSDSAQAKLSDYEDIANLAPRAVVLDVWVRVESLMERLLIARNISFSRGDIWQEGVKLLEAEDVGEKKVAILYNLRRLHNYVAHNKDMDLTKRRVMEYAEIALKVAAFLSNLADRRGGSLL